MRSARTAWWETRTCVLLAVAAALVPLLYPPIPPLVDLLGHMGRYRVELDLGRSAWLSRYYSFHWTPVGNLGVDLVVRLLSPMLGVEWATKLVVLAIPALTVAGLLWVAREVHGRIPPTAYFALPFAYGHPYLQGFVNYALAMALALLAFAYWLQLGRKGQTRRRALLFVPLSLLIYFAHAFGWGVLGLLCICAEMQWRRRHGAGWARAAGGTAQQAARLALPLFVILVWRSAISGPVAWAWFDWQAKLVWFETALRDRWQAFDVASVLIIAALLAMAVRSPRLRFSPALMAGALALLAVFVLLPTNLFGSAYADMRLAPYILALLVLAIDVKDRDARRFASGLAAAALVFAGIRLGANSISLASAWDEQSRGIGAVAKIPVGARVATFVGFPCGGAWPLPRDLHLGSLVTIRREGFSNDQWLIQGASGLDLQYRTAGYFAADPSQIVIPNGCSDGLHRTIDDALAHFPRPAFDYVWLIGTPAHDGRLTSGLDPVWSSRDSTLFRVAPSNRPHEPAG